MKQIRFTQKTEGGKFEMDSDDGITQEEMEKVALDFWGATLAVKMLMKAMEDEEEKDA